MANYPPTNDTGLARACAGFVSAAAGGGGVGGWSTVAAFLNGYGLGATASSSSSNNNNNNNNNANTGACYNMSAQMPSGHDATISSGDWSGVGTGNDGSSWDFETCTFLVEQIGTNGVTDMFFPRAWTPEWLAAHCKARFNVAPQPRALADLWGFDADTLPRVASRIVFTNGLNDGWSVAGFPGSLSPDLVVINMPNGAHHSDLSHNWPSDLVDTPDVTAAREAIAAQLQAWIAS